LRKRPRDRFGEADACAETGGGFIILGPLAHRRLREAREEAGAVGRFDGGHRLGQRTGLPEGLRRALDGLVDAQLAHEATDDQRPAHDGQEQQDESGDMGHQVALLPEVSQTELSLHGGLAIQLEGNGDLHPGRDGLLATPRGNEAPAADGVVGGLIEAREAAAQLDLDFFGEACGADVDAQQHLALLAEATRGVGIDRLGVVQVVGVEARRGDGEWRGSEVDRGGGAAVGGWGGTEKASGALLGVVDTSNCGSGGGRVFLGFGVSGGFGLGNSGNISTRRTAIGLSAFFNASGGATAAIRAISPTCATAAPVMENNGRSGRPASGMRGKKIPIGGSSVQLDG
jgi:hypothetical protein